MNFVRFGGTGQPYFQTDALWGYVEETGVDAVRQLMLGDPGWGRVEPTQDGWDFSGSDEVLLDARREPVVRLFSLYWQSCTAPWATDFQKTVDADCEDYVRTVVRRYRDAVRYWELGNEMERWDWTLPGQTIPTYVTPPPVMPPGGFTAEEQGAFLSDVARLVREEDPDAVIVLPGMSGLDAWSQEWLSGVVAGGGTAWFDVVNYHYYGPWQEYEALRTSFDGFLDGLALGDKPVWMSETGVTSDATLTVRTDYGPNSEVEQAADVFRRTLPAWAHGEVYVGWHTLIGGTASDDAWRFYGLYDDTPGAPTAHLALRTMQLLTSEVLPFDEVRDASEGAVRHFEITRADGARVHVMWGDGVSAPAPAGMTEVASVVPDAGGDITWEPAGESVALADDLPILLRE